MLIGEAAILATARFTDISWLWYNVIGAVVVVTTALVISALFPEPLPPHEVRDNRDPDRNARVEQVLMDVRLDGFPALAQEVSQPDERRDP